MTVSLHIIVIYLRISYAFSQLVHLHNIGCSPPVTVTSGLCKGNVFYIKMKGNYTVTELQFTIFL